MNGLAALLGDLHSAGLRLWLAGGRIAYSGPLTPKQAEAICQHREDMIALLRRHGDALLPLFRDLARPLTDRERTLIEANAAELRQRFRVLAGERQDPPSAQVSS